MSTVVNKTTFQVIPLANTPDYDPIDWLINPVFPQCASKYWKLVGETLEEMTQLEKDEVDYSTSATVYMIAEKQLLTGQNGHDYEANANALINPAMPACEIRYTKVVAGAVVEMTAIEKNIVDHPQVPKEAIRRDLSNINNINKLRADSVLIKNKVKAGNFTADDTAAALLNLAETNIALLDMIINL